MLAMKEKQMILPNCLMNTAGLFKHTLDEQLGSNQQTTENYFKLNAAEPRKTVLLSALKYMYKMLQLNHCIPVMYGISQNKI